MFEFFDLKNFWIYESLVQILHLIVNELKMLSKSFNLKCCFKHCLKKTNLTSNTNIFNVKPYYILSC